MNLSWPRYFFTLAESISKKSKDESTQVGCVLTNKDNEILSVGFNGFPRGVKDLKERYSNRELKYKLIVHSEMNAVAIAAKNGHRLEGSRLFIAWLPCSSCAKILIQTGITEINIDGLSKQYNNKELQERWKEEIDLSTLMFNEAGVKINIIME